MDQERRRIRSSITSPVSFITNRTVPFDDYLDDGTDYLSLHISLGSTPSHDPRGTIATAMGNTAVGHVKEEETMENVSVEMVREVREVAVDTFAY